MADEVPWGKIAAGVGTAIGLAAAGIGTYSANREVIPVRRPIVLGDESELQLRVRELSEDFRKRIEALERYQAQHEAFAQTQSAAFKEQIADLMRARDLMMGMLQANSERLNRMVDPREMRRQP